MADLFSLEVIVHVNALLKKGNDSGSVVSVWEEIQETLIKNGLAWRAQIPPEFVGVHPENRSKLGVGGSESHHHGWSILQAGWSKKKASDVACIETESSDHAAQQANDSYAELSGGFIPKVKQLKYVSIGGGHTNAFLRACKASCSTPVAKLADSTGHLNVSELALGKPAFADAVENGMTWFVMHRRCPVVWPNIVSFAQGALNTHSNSQQNELEVMLDIHGRMADYIKRGLQPDWKAITEASLHSLPPCAAYIDALVNYVRDNCGGEDGELLHELAEFYKAFEAAASDRRLGSEFVAKLASLTFGPERFPYTLNGCVEANLISPINKIVDGLCKLILPSYLNALTIKGNRGEVKKAEKLMGDCRSLCAAVGVERHHQVKCIGKLDVRLVMHLLNRLKDIEPKPFKTIDDIAEAIGE